MTGFGEKADGLVHASAQGADILFRRRQQLRERGVGEVDVICCQQGECTGDDKSGGGRQAGAGGDVAVDVEVGTGAETVAAVAQQPLRGRFRIVAPVAGVERRNRIDQFVRARRKTGCGVVQRDASILPSGSGNDDIAVDGDRQHRQVIVVGMFAEQIDSARGAHDEIRRTSEPLLRGVADAGDARRVVGGPAHRSRSRPRKADSAAARSAAVPRSLQKP